jgi:hypothetical protein
MLRLSGIGEKKVQLHQFFHTNLADKLSSAGVKDLERGM